MIKLLYNTFDYNSSNMKGNTVQQSNPSGWASKSYKDESGGIVQDNYSLIDSKFANMNAEV